MKDRLKILVHLSVGIATGAIFGQWAFAQDILYSENFESPDSATNWTVNLASARDLATFGFDYSKIGVPPAPGATTTLGLKLQANRPIGTTVKSGVSVSPKNQSFTGSYVLEFDMWANFPGPAPEGGSGSTQLTGGGIMSSGTTANFDGAGDGLWFATTGESGATFDFRVYFGGVNQNVAGLFNAGGQGHELAYYQTNFPGGISAPAAQIAVFPSQTGETRAGTIGWTWRHLRITKSDNVVTWDIDDIRISTVNLTDNGIDTLGGNNVLLVQSDINDSATSAALEPALFGLIDNLRVTTMPCTRVPPGIVAWWPGNGNVEDIIGANNGSQLNGVSFAAGKVSSAMSFDGADDLVTIPGSPTLHVGLGNGFSVEAWINPSDLSRRPIFEWRRTPPYGVHLWISEDTSGNLFANITDESGGWHFLSTGSGVVSANTFQHVALTYEKASGVGRILVNGVIVAEENLGSFTPETSEDLLIGGRRDNENVSFRGLIDELKIYNRALSVDEVKAVYLAGSAGVCRPQCVQPNDSILAWWPGDRATTDIISTNRGILHNGASVVSGFSQTAFGLDGVDDFIETPAVASGLQEGTVELWFKLKSRNENTGMSVWSGTAYLPGSGNSFDVMDLGTFTGGSAGQLVFGIYAPEWNWAESGVVPETNVWYHIAGTWGSSGVRIYVNGVLKGSNSYSAGAPAFAHNIIGSSSYTGTSVNGSIDEVSVYGRALSPSDIASIYAAGSTGKCKPPIACVAPAAGIVGSWSGNGSEQETVGGFSGTLNGGMSFGPGKVGHAFAFDGVDDYLEVADTPVLRARTTGSISIELWANFDHFPRTSDFSDTMTLLEKDNDYLLSWRSDLQQIIFDITDNCDGLYHLGFRVSLPSLNAGEWHHYAVTATDWGLLGPTFHFYFDGAEMSVTDNSYLAHTTCGFYQGPTGNLRFGGRTVAGYPERFAGRLDEVSIYNTALRSDEVAAIYQADVVGKCSMPSVSLPSGLQLWWNFTDGSASDSSGFHNDGIATGSPLFRESSVRFDNPTGGQEANQWIALPYSASIKALETSSFTFAVRYKSTDAGQQNGRLFGTYSGGIVIDYNDGVRPCANGSVSDGLQRLAFPSSVVTDCSQSVQTTDGAYHWQIISVDRPNQRATQRIDTEHVAQYSFTDLGPIGLAGMILGATRPSDTYAARDTTVDELLIFNRALSEQEVLTLVTTDTSRFSVPATGLDRPDLRPEISASAGSAVYGEKIGLTWVVRNAGVASANSVWSDHIYLSSDTNNLAGAQSLQDFLSVASLPPGSSYTNTQTVALPLDHRSTSGSYYLIIKTDSGNSVSENNETNNIAFVPISVVMPPVPDLAVNSISAPSVGEVNESILLVFTITNRGSQVAKAPWQSQILLSSDLTGAGAQGLATVQQVTSLPAATSLTLTQAVTLPRNSVGPHYLGVAVDTTDAVFEADETNNSAIATISTDIRAPDLVITSVSPPATALSGQPVPIIWMVANQGNANASGHCRDTVMIANDETGTGASSLATFDFPISLEPGATLVRTGLVTVPFGLFGPRFLFIQTDSTDDVAEGQNEDNNLSIGIPLQVTISDLVVEWVGVTPNSLQFGGSASVTWVVRNIGDGPALSGWSDQLLLSPNPAGTETIPLLTTISVSTLVPGASYTNTQVITVPLDAVLSEGNHYFVATADSGSTQAEANNANNNGVSSALSIAFPPLPDLTVQRIEGPTNGLSGQSITLTWAVTNQGAALAEGPWTDSILLTDNPKGTNAAPIFSLTYSNILAPGDFLLLTAIVTLPASAFGERYFVVHTDSSNQVLERFLETNNTVVASQSIFISPPDLTVTDVQGATGAYTDSAFEVRWTIHNNGLAPARGQWIDRVYLSADAEVGNDILIGEFPFTNGLEPGESVTRIQPVIIPRGGLVAGNYRLIVITDAANSVAEGLDEGNNTAVSAASLSLKMTPLPDLVVESISIPPIAYSDQTITVHWTVRNVGPGSTDASGWQDRVFLSTNQTADSSDGWQINVPNGSYLAPGEAYVGSVDVRVPLTSFGTYYLIVRTDAGNNVREENESNNDTPKTIEIQLTPPPDLQVVSVETLANSFSGQTIPVSWKVGNLGAGAVPPEFPSWNDTVLLSKSADRSLETFTLFTQRHTGTLGTNQIYNVVNASVNLPPNIFGDYYLFVQTDSANELFEYGLDNNNVSVNPSVIHVTLLPPPDLVVQSVKTVGEGIAGQPLTVSWQVANQGAGDTVTTLWYDSLYVSTNVVFDASARRVADIYHAGLLDAGSAYTNSTTYTPPLCNSAKYYFFVVTDRYGHVHEFDPEFNAETNNTGGTSKPTIVTALEVADLVVSSVGELSSARAGQNVQLTWGVMNSGNATTTVRSWVDRVYLSTGPSLNSSAITLGTFAHTGELVPGGAYVQTHDVPIPGNLSGSYYLFVRCDADDAVPECAGEANNDAHGASTVQIVPQPAPRLPDFQVVSIDVPSNIQSGEPISIAYVVTNIGVGDSPIASWQDAVYLSKDSVLSGDDLLLTRVDRTGYLVANGSYSASARPQLPFRLSGQYYVLVCADSSQTILELNENNCAAPGAFIQITQAPLADLRVTDISTPETGLAGLEMNIAWTVTNTGDNSTESANWTDYVYLSRDQILDPTDPQIGYTPHVGILAPNQSYAENAIVTLPRGFTGPYYVFVFTDRGDRIFELNELNNAGYTTVPVELSLPPPADFQVTSITIPSSGSPGQPGLITWAVRNNGPNTANGTWTDSIYLSGDNAWDINDALIGKISRSGPLRAGESYSGTITANLPGVVPGQYRVIVRTDILNNVRETDEGNNMAISPNQIAMDVTELQLGVPFHSQLSQSGDHYYKIVAPPGEVLSIDLDADSTNSFNELFTRFGALPDRGEYDFLYGNPFEPDQQITVPETQAGNYYNLVHGNTVQNPHEDYAIIAATVPFGITAVSPSKIGDNGQVTITLSGAKFKEGATVTLIKQGVQLVAARVTVVDAAKSKARFLLNKAPTGIYDVAFSNADGTTTTLRQGLTIEPALPPKIQTSIKGNRFPRGGQSGDYACVVRNLSNVDAPYVIVRAEIQGTTSWALRRPATAFPQNCRPCGLQSTSMSDINTLTGGFIIKDLDASDFATFSVSLKGISAPTQIAFAASSKTEDEFASLVLEFAENLRQAFLETSSIRLPALFQKALSDPIEWQTLFIRTIATTGLIDALRLSQKPLVSRTTESVPKANAAVNEICENFCKAGKIACWLHFGTEVIEIPECLEGCAPLLVLQPEAYPPCTGVCFITVMIAHLLCDVLVDECELICHRLDCSVQEEAFLGAAGLAICPQFPRDPNELNGPIGFGVHNTIKASVPMDYTVHFENVAEATAAARQVTVVSSISPEMDSRTVRLGEISIADFHAIVPPDRSFYQARLQLGSKSSLLVDIMAGIDIQARQVRWTMTAIDPSTGEPPENPMLGLLSPNDTNHVGEGYVSYTVMPKRDILTGTIITNEATIVFDMNEPIDTNPWINAIDTGAPTSNIQPLLVNSLSSFEVQWAGTDDQGGSGIATFAVYVSADGGEYSVWLQSTTQTNALFSGTAGHTYSFFSVARDNVGNAEEVPSTPDATTTVRTGATRLALVSIPDQIVRIGSRVFVTNTVENIDAVQPFSFFFAQPPPTGATLDASSGIFAWTPAPVFASTTNTITIGVQDSGDPIQSDTKSFKITVLPDLNLTFIFTTDQTIHLKWSSRSAGRYRIEYTSDVESGQWQDGGTVDSTPPQNSNTIQILPSGHRFYRVTEVFE